MTVSHLHDGQCRSPVRPEPRQQHPEDAIAASQFRTFGGVLESGNLLPQCQVLKRYGGATDKERPEE